MARSVLRIVFRRDPVASPQGGLAVGSYAVTRARRSRRCKMSPETFRSSSPSTRSPGFYPAAPGFAFAARSGSEPSLAALIVTSWDRHVMDSARDSRSRAPRALISATHRVSMHRRLVQGKVACPCRPDTFCPSIVVESGRTLARRRAISVRLTARSMVPSLDGSTRGAWDATHIARTIRPSCMHECRLTTRVARTRLGAGTAHATSRR
jgi:hypothetical protein